MELWYWAVVLTALLALDIASWFWGVDSRDGFADGRLERTTRSFPGSPRNG